MFSLRIQTRAEFSNKKQQNAVLYGAKHSRDLCCLLAFILYLMAAVAVGWMGPAAARWGKHYRCSPEVEAGTQVFHPQAVWTILPQSLALGTGVFKYGITTGVQVKALPWNRRKLTDLRFEYNGSLFVIFHIE